MYNSFRQFCERLLRIPPDPEPPPGDEASTQSFRAAPNFFKYLLLLWALKTGATLLAFLTIAVAPIAGAFALARQGHGAGWFLLLIPGFILGVAGGFRIFALAVLQLDFDKRWYLVTDRSLRVREGVFVVREMTVTFANIQNISISQGPIQRILGIADLKVDTAGGGGGGKQGHQPGMNLHTAWFHGINNADKVRELI
ncbi:MAG: PH domain-containing protein, partial [Verrucomicrobiota bacterium]